MPGGHRRIDRVLAPDFLDGLEGLPIEQVRERRREAEQEEVDLSYLRRLLHGRLDIVEAELQRRGSPGQGDLVERLSEILADPARAAHGSGRHLTVEPSRVDEHRRRVEQVVADVGISDVTRRTDDELVQSLADLRAIEAEVSEVRRSVQVVADACSAELARRYRDGLASVDDVLAHASERGAPDTP